MTHEASLIFRQLTAETDNGDLQFKLNTQSLLSQSMLSCLARSGRVVTFDGINFSAET